MDPNENEQPQEPQQPQVVPLQESPNSPEENTPSSELPKPKKSKKKLIILALVGLLLIGAAAAAYFLFLAKDEEPESEPEVSIEEPVEPTERLTFSTNQASYTLNNEGDDLEAIAELEETERLVDVSDDQSVIVFTKNTVDTNDVLTPTSLWTQSNNEETKVLDITDESDTVFGSVSPDNQAISYFYYTGTPQNPTHEVGSYNLNDGEKTAWYTLGSSDDPLLGVSPMWSDVDTLITNELSCYQCDTAGTNKIWKVERDSEEPELLATLNEDDSFRSGNTFVNTQTQTVYASTSDLSGIGATSEDIANSTTQIYSVDVASGEKAKVYETTGKDIQLFSSSSDGSSLLASVLTPAESDDSETISYESKEINLINIESGNATPIPLSLTQLENSNAFFTGATYSNLTDTLFFTVSSSPSDASADTRLVLYSLTINEDEGEQPVKTLFDETGDANLFTVTALNIHQTTDEPTDSSDQ